jgi:hypothetical protein
MAYAEVLSDRLSMEIRGDRLGNVRPPNLSWAPKDIHVFSKGQVEFILGECI